MADDPLAHLRARFKLRCVEDLAALNAWPRPGDEDPDTALGLLAHKLSGVAGSFGYGEISDLAGRIDDALTQGLRPAVADIADLKRALAKACRDVAGPA